MLDACCTGLLLLLRLNRPGGPSYGQFVTAGRPDESDFPAAACTPMCQNEAGFRSRLTVTTEGPPLINPVHLRTLVEVVRLGSFAAAATRLGYTASAVSQQMSALERDTGVALLQRSARSINPTEAAVVMTQHAAKVLTDIDALVAAAAR